MAPFEVLYGRRCCTLLNLIEPGEKLIVGADLVEEAEVIVHHIQDNLKAVKSHQKTYASKRHRPLEVKVGDHVYLRVLPESREVVWGERKVSASLHWAIPHPQEM
jgi:hypothetical protein